MLPPRAHIYWPAPNGSGKKARFLPKSMSKVESKELFLWHFLLCIIRYDDDGNAIQSIFEPFNGPQNIAILKLTRCYHLIRFVFGFEEKLL